MFCEFCGHKPFYSISVSGAFLGTSLPPTPSWSRFDLHVYTYVYSIVFNCISNYTLYFMYCIITNCKDRACSTPPFFIKFYFDFRFFAITSVSVWCFFCSCVGTHRPGIDGSGGVRKFLLIDLIIV